MTLLQAHLEREHVFMPAGFASESGRATSIADAAFKRVQSLKLPRQPCEGAFGVNPLTSTLVIGHDLLHPLSEQPPAVLGRLGQLFTLHETVHEDQGIGSHNYQGIGRSGVVLEDVDFWADAFAIGTAAVHHIHRNGPAAEARSAQVVIDFIDAHIAAMRAFDRMEQGVAQLRVMPERRLRRYLIWYLQRARATAVKGPADVRQLLGARLFVELAPLRGRLDDRGDKIVSEAVQATTLTVALGGLARRVPALPDNFSPAALVDAVRQFDEGQITRQMTYVVTQERDLLVPWQR